MKINHRRFRTALAVVALLSGVAWAPVQAQVSVNINIAPPAPRYEAVPRVPQGYVWAPGFWVWQGQDYRWVGGRQIAVRPGYRWVADHWEAGNRYRAGYWEPESRRGRKQDHGRDNRDDRNDHDDKHDGKGHKDKGDFCPPGQAKKGNC